MVSSEVYFLFPCSEGVGLVTGGGKGERGGGGDVSSRVLGGVGTRTCSVMAPFLKVIRQAYCGLTLNCTFRRCKSIHLVSGALLTSTSPRGGIAHTGSSVDSRHGGWSCRRPLTCRRSERSYAYRGSNFFTTVMGSVLGWITLFDLLVLEFRLVVV